MVEPPKISVYIPAYNAAAHIAGCIQGLLSQTLAPDEILVVNDGSTDATVSIARTFPVKLMDFPANRGLAAARNAGLGYSRNDLVAAIDADCIADKFWLEKLATLFQTQADLVAAGGRLEEQVIRCPADLWRKTHLVQHWGNNVVVNPNFLFGHSFLVRKSVIKKIGGYPEVFRTNGEDVYMGLLIRRHGGKMIYDPDAITNHLKEDNFNSIMNAKWRYDLYASFANRLLKSPSARLDSLPKQILHRFTNNLQASKKYLIQDIRANRISILHISLAIPFSFLKRDRQFYKAKKLKGNNASA